ncbi:TPA: helix-turn-helix transcriptional regulator [Morganella morganii]|nr:helix-turn-helix transcriptional regulator [Morganella morganii]HAT1526679.1 helix-turn-helix transcriptional regulator [Morganella morganii]
MKKNPNETSAARISQVLVENGWSQSDLARRIGVKPQSVQFWVSGKTAPSGTNLSALASISGYPEHWFLMDALSEGTGKKNLPAKKSDSYIVELLDIEASAGPGIITKGEFVETIRSIEYTSDEALRLFGHRPSENIKMITVSGDSMEGTINPGDQIFIDIHINYFDGDGVYVFAYGQTLHIKRLQMIKEQLTVISDNNNYRDWQITEEDEDKLFIAGKVLISQSRIYKRYA